MGLAIGPIALIAAPVVAIWAIIGFKIGGRGEAMALSDTNGPGEATSVS